MSKLPLVSILMPIRNEAAFIERSLGGVLVQDYPHDRCLEVQATLLIGPSYLITYPRFAQDDLCT